ERSADQLREFAAGALEVLGSRARLVADDDEITVGGDAVTSPLHEPQPHGLGQGALLDAEAQLDLRGDLVDVLASRSTGADRVPAQLVPGHVQVRRDGEELGHGASLARSGGASTLVVANPTSWNPLGGDWGRGAALRGRGSKCAGMCQVALWCPLVPLVRVNGGTGKCGGAAASDTWQASC